MEPTIAEEMRETSVVSIASVDDEQEFEEWSSWYNEPVCLGLLNEKKYNGKWKRTKAGWYLWYLLPYSDKIRG